MLMFHSFLSRNPCVPFHFLMHDKNNNLPKLSFGGCKSGHWISLLVEKMQIIYIFINHYYAALVLEIL